MKTTEPVTMHTCRLCGRSCRRSRLQLEEHGRMLHFCCPGCLHVFQILVNGSDNPDADFRSSDLFKACVAQGIIPEKENNISKDSSQLSVSKEDMDRTDKDFGLEVTLHINGMECISCAWLVEEFLQRTPGVLAAQVMFLTDTVRVSYLPHRIQPREIGERISRLGYMVYPEEEPEDVDRKKSLLRLGTAAILTLNIMMISFVLYGGFFQEFENPVISALSLPLCLLAAPVVFYCGWPIIIRGWYGIRSGQFSMDTLVGIGALTTFGYSLYQMTHHSLHLYFDTAAMLITLVLLGRFIETGVRRKLTANLNIIRDIVGRKVRMLVDGRERWLAMCALKAGDVCVVKAGERIPVDGQVVSGRGEIDESVLTGESRPVTKKSNDDVLAGSLLLSGDLHVSATRIGVQSSMGQMIALVHKALAVKNPVEQFADRIAGLFVPLVFLTALATAAVLIAAGSTGDTAVLRAVTILVIACPCALGIATPLAKAAIIGKGGSLGIIIRNAAAFEQAFRLNAMVFDKTGTITEGRYRIGSLYAPSLTEAAVLKRMVAVEYGAQHFLARELTRIAAERGLHVEPAEKCRNFPGLGVTGWVDGEEITVGSRRFMQERNIDIPAEISRRTAEDEQKGFTIVFAAWRKRVRAAAAFGDTLKPGVKQLLTFCRDRGIQVWLVSGDSQATTAAIAAQLNVHRFIGQAKPEDKLNLVSRLRKQGRLVGMIGDGLNDSAALAGADVGFSIGGNLGNFMAEAADVTLLGDDINRLPAALQLSRMLVRAVRQNLTFAFLYNGIGIPLAALGLLSPLLAVSAMAASSLTVIGNTLRTARAGDNTVREKSSDWIVVSAAQGQTALSKQERIV